MYLTIATLTADPGTQQRPAAPPLVTDPDALRDALLRHVAPDDGVEHVRVQVIDGEVRLGVLSLADNEREAVDRCRSLCLRTLRAEPMLAGYRLTADEM